MKALLKKRNTRKLVIGLTGGIAAGKSSAAEEFKKLGAGVVDADAITRELYKPGAVVYKSIVRAFGPDVLGRGKSISRARLGDIVFASGSKRKMLERITHPHIIKRIENRIRKSSRNVLIVEAPLLYEAGLHKSMDRVIVVSCAKASQISRLLKRGMDKRAAEARISSQMALSKKEKMADYVIRNSGARAELKRNVKKIWYALTNAHNNV